MFDNLCELTAIEFGLCRMGWTFGLTCLLASAFNFGVELVSKLARVKKITRRHGERRCSLVKTGQAVRLTNTVSEGGDAGL